MSTYRVHNAEFKLSVVRDLESGEKRLAQVCREHNLSAGLVSRWRSAYRAEGQDAFICTRERADQLMPQGSEQRIAALESALGRAHLEIDFLQRALAKKGSAAERKWP